MTIKNKYAQYCDLNSTRKIDKGKYEQRKLILHGKSSGLQECSYWES